MQPHGLYSPWDSLGPNTGVGSLSLLQGSSLPRDRTQVSLKGRRGEIVFRIKFHTHQRCSESSTTKKKQPPCVHQYPGIPQETGPDLLLSVSVSPAEAEINSGLPWGQGHWQQQSWEVEAHVGMSPLGSCQKPYHTAFRLQDWWPQTIQLTGREHSPAYQHRVTLKFY